MSIFCEACCGDGLNHPNNDVFEIYQDEPCHECGGEGVFAGDPVKDAKFLNKYRSEWMAVYVGEGIDDFVEYEVAWSGGYIPAEYGAREHGTGVQLEPDYPAGWELDDFYIRVNGNWYPVDPEDETVIIGKRQMTMYDLAIYYMEDV